MGYRAALAPNDTAWTPNDLEAERRSLLASPPLTSADTDAL